MMHKFSGMLLLWLLLMSPQLTAGGEPRYPVSDSKFPAAEAKLGWLDNEQVMFHGYEIGKVGQASPDDGHLMAETGLFIWDTGKGTVTKYWDIDGPVPLCVFRGRIFLSRKVKGKDNAWFQVSGLLGKEEQKVVFDKVSVNGHSCQVSDQRPSWMKEDKHRRLRLLEEHGYLDFGISSRADPSKAVPILLYQPDAKNPLQLPFTGEQVRLHVAYFEFANAYLLESQRETTYAAPVWLLKPDGTVIKLFEPSGKAWERFGWDLFNLTKKGLFLSGGRGGYTNVGTRGGYLLKSSEETPTRIIAGNVRNETVSPDGCKVAFVHVLHDQAGADSIKALRDGKTGTRTLKMIDLCQGD